MLALDAPVIVDDGFGRLSSLVPKTGVWPLRIEHSWGGELVFPINDDQGTAFRRVKRQAKSPANFSATTKSASGGVGPAFL